MWLFTRYGFFSIVKIENQDNFFLRSRSKKDLKIIINKLLPHYREEDILVTYNSDYFYRLVIDYNDLQLLLIGLGQTLDYSNFKSKIAELKGQFTKLLFYSRIWSIMYSYQHELFNKTQDANNTRQKQSLRKITRV